MNSEHIETLRERIDPVAEKHGAFVVGVEVQSGNTEELWIYVDAEESDVTISQCAAISREAAALLDEEDFSGGRYNLNVSSPGLSRPLSDNRQYGKNRGRLARIKYKAGDEYRKAVGKIDNADKDSVVISENGDHHTIPFGAIVEAKILPEF
ncbi:MAG: ribosome maturation factor RimP [Balneolaceae bacterium]|nr:MAG: ribosome maturation factor RimP [Balneolaceae bacterium]